MVTYGDAEAAVVAVIGADPDVAAFGDVTASTGMVGYSHPARWVRITRTGGVPVLWMRLDNPVIELDVYAETKSAALDLAAAARSAVFAARGGYSGNGLELYDVADSEGLAWHPDTEDPSVPRYTLSLALVTRPLG